MSPENLTNVYNNNPTLQSQYSLQQYLDLFGQGGTTQPDPDPDPDPTPDPDPDPTTPPIQSAGGGGGGGIQGLQLTYTPGAQLKSTPAISDISSQNISTYLKDPNLQAKYANSKEYDDFVQSQMPQPNFLQRGITGVKDFFGKFNSGPKVRGTLGDRQQAAYDAGQKLPSIFAAIGRTMSPFNPESKNYNRNMARQLNYLEGTDGTKLSGNRALMKDGKYGIIENLPMIGIDSQSGLKKYGPGTVLEGLNVTSAFGSNNLVSALDRYIDKMKKRGTKDGIYDEKNLTPYQLEKLKKAKLEKQSYYDTAFKNEQEKQRQIEEAKFQATLEKEQRRQRQNDLDRIERAYREDTGGQAGSYAPGGGSGIQRDSKGNETGYNDPFDPGGGEKDGGHIDGTNRRKDYRYGGRASYFDGGIAGFKNGGRINFRGGGSYQGGRSSSSSSSSKSSGPAGGASAGGNYGGNRNKSQTYGGSIFRGGGGGGNNNPPPKDNNPPPKKPKPKVKKNISTGSFFPTFNFLKKFRAHDKYTDQLKASQKPNYHELGGLDFMARFPNLNPDIAKGLATGYQNVFEVGRALADGPGGMTVGNALNKAKEESRLNAAGIDAYANPDSSLYQNYFNQDPLTGAVPFNNQSMATGGRVNYFNGGIVSLRRR